MSPPTFSGLVLSHIKQKENEFKRFLFHANFLSENTSHLLKALLFLFQLRDRVSVKEIALISD